MPPPLGSRWRCRAVGTPPRSQSPRRRAAPLKRADRGGRKVFNLCLIFGAPPAASERRNKSSGTAAPPPPRKKKKKKCLSHPSEDMHSWSFAPAVHLYSLIYWTESAGSKSEETDLLF